MANDVTREGAEATARDMHDNDNIRYAVCQEEQPKGFGTRTHLQGYIEFDKSLRMSEVKKILGFKSIHLEWRKGSRADARGYCSSKKWKGVEKGRIAGPYETGKWRNDFAGSVSKKNSPTDISVECLIAGMTPAEIAAEHPKAFFTHSRKILDTYEALREALNLGIFEYSVRFGEEE